MAKFIVHHDTGIAFLETTNLMEANRIANERWNVNEVDLISEKKYLKWCELLGIKIGK